LSFIAFPLFLCSRGPTPLAFTRRPGFAGLPSGASLKPQALLCSRGFAPLLFSVY